MRYEICDMKNHCTKILDPITGDYKIENICPCHCMDKFLVELKALQNVKIEVIEME